MPFPASSKISDVICRLIRDRLALAVIAFNAAIACGQHPIVDLVPLELDLPADLPESIDVNEAPSGAKNLLTNLVLKNLPNDYEDARRWGGTRTRWDGLKVKVDGLQVRTKRRWKTVNHGTWKKVTVRLVDPEEYLKVRIANLKTQGPGKCSFDLAIHARLDVRGRMQEWNNGIRLFSVSADATADVEMELGFDVSTRLDTSRFPPDVRVEPVARRAQVRLRQLRLERISKADGPVVRELGDALEKVLRRKLDKDNEKLVAKINRQIQKNDDKLRFSLHDLVKHQWLGIKPKRETQARNPKKSADDESA